MPNLERNVLRLQISSVGAVDGALDHLPLAHVAGQGGRHLGVRGQVERVGGDDGPDGGRRQDAGHDVVVEPVEADED